MNPVPYDLIIGLDRADKKADLCLIETATGQRRGITIDTAPEALCEWLGGAARVIRCAASFGSRLKRGTVNVEL